MLSKNIVKKSVKSTSETTNKIFLKKKKHLYPNSMVPHLSATPQYPTSDPWSWSSKCFTWWLPKAQNGIQEKKSSELGNHHWRNKFQGVNFGGVHIEIFRSSTAPVQLLPTHLRNQDGKNLTENLWCWKKITYLSIVTNTTPGESKQKNPTK